MRLQRPPQTPPPPHLPIARHHLRFSIREQHLRHSSVRRCASTRTTLWSTALAKTQQRRAHWQSATRMASINSTHCDKPETRLASALSMERFARSADSSKSCSNALPFDGPQIEYRSATKNPAASARCMRRDSRGTLAPIVGDVNRIIANVCVCVCACVRVREHT